MVWMILAVFSAFCLMLPLPMQARELPGDLPIRDRGRQAVLAGVSEVARSSHAVTDASAAGGTWYPGRLSYSPVYSATLEEKSFLPVIWKAPVTPVTDEWTQHAHDAQHTSFAPRAVPTPWRWKWAWNGPNATGGIASGKFGLPRNSQPVTGGGRVYIAAGSRGVYALDNANGAVVWARNPGGNINSTPAYDPDTGALFVLSSNGTLYKLDAANGATLAQFVTGSTSNLPLPPAWHGGRVFISMGNRVYAIDKFTMSQVWSYDAGSPVHTPPAYSPSRDVVVVASQDLFVHGINNANGSRRWRVKPTPRRPADSYYFTEPDMAEVRYGWPVIAEGHGLALIKYRLDWNALWRLSPWPPTNDAMRAALHRLPGEQALYALRLTDGASAFIAHVGHGGFGDGDYLPMGPQPVVKRFADGSEVVYTVIRGRLCNPGGSCDGRWDSQLGEMMLNDNTVPGYLAGYVRFIRNTSFPTDEQAYVSMAGDHLFGGHWEAGIAHQITDRSASRGAFINPILTTDLPHIATSQDWDVCGTGFRASHYCGAGLQNTRPWPGGFYIYWRQGAVYDRYWSGYATWVVSNDTVYFVSTDGAVVALEHGTPPGAGTAMTALPEAEPATEPADAPNMIIPYTQARAYAGRIVAVEGVIAYVFNNGKSVLLGFENPHQGAFKAQILKQYWSAFPAPPETLYQVGQRVRVRGKIEWYQGDPAIYVRASTQIEADRE